MECKVRLATVLCIVASFLAQKGASFQIADSRCNSRAIQTTRRSHQPSQPSLSNTQLYAVPPTFGLFDKIRRRKKDRPEEVSLCIIGGGVAGLAAAFETSKTLKPSDDCKVVLLEASETLGGRVKSDKTEDGFILDRGFAVFIEEYPMAKQLLDYDNLQLGKFLPGALVKIKDTATLARVTDPFRQPETIVEGVLAPIGSLLDKVNLLPAIFHCKGSSVETLFAEEETDTLTALMVRWNLGPKIVDRFFKPFLEGIYLAPLEQQSSRMFHFVFKMFSEGAATLPKCGIGAIADQLANKAKASGVDIRTSTPVTKIASNDDGFRIECQSGQSFQAQTIVVATEGPSAQKLLSQLPGLESLEVLSEQPQRKVGCLYYTFDGPAPITDPILILNGMKGDIVNQPVNNVCFPSVVSSSYAPSGKSLISVTVLSDVMDVYEDAQEELDQAVRKQLATWFPDFAKDILTKWQFRRMYKIDNAQPGQYMGPFPANVHGGRISSIYRGKKLPANVFVCGDHMSTATLNGALESGVNAGMAAGQATATKARAKAMATT